MSGFGYPYFFNNIKGDVVSYSDIDGFTANITVNPTSGNWAAMYTHINQYLAQNDGNGNFQVFYVTLQDNDVIEIDMIIGITQVADDFQLTIQRGYEGITSMGAVPAGTTVEMRLTAGHWNDMWANVFPAQQSWLVDAILLDSNYQPLATNNYELLTK